MLGRKNELNVQGGIAVSAPRYLYIASQSSKHLGLNSS